MSRASKTLPPDAFCVLFATAMVVGGCSFVQEYTKPLLGGHGSPRAVTDVRLSETSSILSPAAARVVAQVVHDGLASPDRSHPVAWQAGAQRGDVRIGVPFSVNDMPCRDIRILVKSKGGKLATGDTLCQNASGEWRSVTAPPTQVVQTN